MLVQPTRKADVMGLHKIGSVESLPLPTTESLFIDSITKVSKDGVTESLTSWSKKYPDQLKENINVSINPHWEKVMTDPSVVQNDLKVALTSYRKDVRKWMNPDKKMTPSLKEAIDAFMYNNGGNINRGIAPNPKTLNFIEVGMQLKRLTEQLIAMDQLLCNFKCFDSLRSKYSERLQQIKTLAFEYSPIEFMHKHPSIKKSKLELGYTLLLSVVPNMLELIETIVGIICSEIPNAEMTDEEVDEWAKTAKEQLSKTVHHTVHFEVDVKTRVETLSNENETLMLRKLLDEKTKENQNLRAALREREAANEEGNCSFEKKHEPGVGLPCDELEELLRLCRQKAGQSNMETQLETNYSTENFAYGVFDSRGGNLSVGIGDINLFIPKGAISSTQEIYLYIDPNARFLKGIREDKQETRVAPIVTCGPPGTSFLSHVVLTFPHNAVEEEKWQFTAVRSEGDRQTDDWQNIDDVEDDDSIFIVDDGFCMFMVKHFTRFTITNSTD